MRVAVLLASTLVGCYEPSELRSCLTCDVNNASCPEGRVCNDGFCLAAGEAPELCGDPPPDPGCFASALIGQICPDGAPARAINDHSINTNQCLAEGGEEHDHYCLILAEQFSISGVVRATGAFALVIASNTTIDLSGTIDASADSMSGGAGSNTDCPVGGANGLDGKDMNGETFGGGGGAGGSFQGAGGSGGNGEQAVRLPNGGAGGADQAQGLRGGCAGGSGGNTGTVGGATGGRPGAGGGAIYLVARDSITLSSSAAILAGGRGGGGGLAPAGGGGGGGSGGLIAFDASALEVISGNPVLCANSGGGGGGGENNTDGTDGGDGCRGGTMPATGGPGGSTNVDGGDGGVGSSLATTGSSGMGGDDGGGGGAGGGGYILVFRASLSDLPALIINVSPSLTPP